LRLPGLDENEDVQFRCGKFQQAPDVGFCELLPRHPHLLAEPGVVPLGPPVDQLSGDNRRSVDLVGEDGDLLRGDDPVDRPPQATAVDGDEDSIVPRFLDPGEGILDAGQVGENLDPLLGEVAHEETGHAEEVRVAGAEHHAALLRDAQELQHDGEVFQDHLFPGKIGKDIQVPLVSDQHLGLAYHLQGLLAETLPAGDTGADEIDLLLWHTHLPKNNYP